MNTFSHTKSTQIHTHVKVNFLFFRITLVFITHRTRRCGNKNRVKLSSSSDKTEWRNDKTMLIFFPENTFVFTNNTPTEYGKSLLSSWINIPSPFRFHHHNCCILPGIYFPVRSEIRFCVSNVYDQFIEIIFFLHNYIFRSLRFYAK